MNGWVEQKVRDDGGHAVLVLTIQLSNENKHGCLGYIGIILPSYVGIIS